MISKSQLLKAVEKDLLSENQLEPLFQFLNQENMEDSHVEEQEEPLKFIRSFGDVFIAIGIIILMIAINMANLTGYEFLLPVAGFVLISEWLVGVRKLVLPGMTLLIAILFFVYKAIDFNLFQASSYDLGILCITSLLYYLRYKMPFSLLPLAAGIVFILVIQAGLDVLRFPLIFSGLGFMVFIAAMIFDVQDTRRVSHLSDSAFWLHLLAAPLMVHGTLFSMLNSEQQWIQSIQPEIIIISFFVLFFLVALLIDRRAMLVSTQLYVIYAVTQLLQNHINGTQNILMLVLMGLGLLVLFFGTYWYLARRFIYGFLSDTRINQYVPDLGLRDVPR